MKVGKRVIAAGRNPGGTDVVALDRYTVGRGTQPKMIRMICQLQGKKGGFVARNDFHRPVMVSGQAELGPVIQAQVTGAMEGYLVESMGG